MLSDNDIRRLMRDAYGAALQSDDNTTRNGAVIVGFAHESLIRGWNHFIAGRGNDKKDREHGLKCSLMEHAERDVIYAAAKTGTSCQGKTMVGNWVACPECARAILLAGINLVICHKECMDRTAPKWVEKVALGLDILKRGGVELIQWSGKVDRIQNLNNGEIWEP